MDEPSGVSGIESTRCLADEIDRSFEAEWALALQPRFEVGALHVSHSDEQEPFHFSGFMYRDDVRVLEPAREPGLPDEPLAELFILGQLGREKLQRHLST